MSHVFHQLYYHFTWATHSREPLIDRTWRAELLHIINEEVKTRGGFPLRHNAMPDHTHVLCRLPPTLLISDFVGQLKGATSFRVNKEIRPQFKLQWQEGYGVVSLRKEKSKKSRVTLIDKKSITGAAICLTCLRGMRPTTMTG